ncbi:hypothetical protein BC938DRAFT_471212 [Jimgerdemannia flammicorona]|uniref:DUF1682-domain-containing protein n=1 Tax=Jimgerdemannia flammicorona TaxID=994334 RepID=A0A433QUU2_9FUNG|nr:hypothetical protein BC938DRAFT_471212 [Jimgerdemannia flammicorona]
MIGFFLIYFVRWWTGSSDNEAIAKQWVSSVIGQLREQFSLIGDERGNTLIKDGPADFILYMSGRRHVQYVHGFIKLKLRNDLAGWISQAAVRLVGFGKPQYDEVTFNVVMNDGEYEPFVLAVLPKSEAKEVREARFDLLKFTKSVNCKRVPLTFTTYCEAADLADLFLDGKLGDAIYKADEFFGGLIISSYPKEAPLKFDGTFPNTVTLIIRLPSDRARLKETKPLVELLTEVIDALPGRALNLKPEIRNKLKKNREEVEKDYAKAAAEERQEELIKKKAEKRKEEEERVRKLSPAEQRKWEEKEKKAELKKQQKKMVRKA